MQSSSSWVWNTTYIYCACLLAVKTSQHTPCETGSAHVIIAKTRAAQSDDFSARASERSGGRRRGNSRRSWPPSSAEAEIARTGACIRIPSPSSQSEGPLKLLEVIVGLRDHHPDGVLQEGVVTLMNNYTGTLMSERERRPTSYIGIKSKNVGLVLQKHDFLVCRHLVKIQLNCTLSEVRQLKTF